MRSKTDLMNVTSGEGEPAKTLMTRFWLSTFMNSDNSLFFSVNSLPEVDTLAVIL